LRSQGTPGDWVAKDATGSYAGGLYGLAVFGIAAAVICAFLLNIRNNAEATREAPVTSPAQ
jgi:ACS family tartrate transporter-like MFS transporter